MRRFGVAVVAIAAAVAMAVGSGSAFASQHNQQACEEAGGTWVSDQGFKTCTFETTETGKNENFQCTTEEETGGRGNIGNKTEGPFTEEEEENTGSGKCPPGQYP